MTDLKALAEKNAHIPTEEIERDIRDTRAEIDLMEKEADAFERVPLGSPDARISHMKASARRTGIKERLVFINQLEGILKYRNGTTS